MIYLDYNATTPVDRKVAEAMLPCILDNFGNPSSSHDLGIAARKAVENARGQVASLLHAQTDEIVFTSGGSESNNAVIKGVADALGDKGRHIVTQSTEHPAVLNPCRYLERRGFEVTFLPVNGEGLVDPDDVGRSITPRTILVTVMHANNETGTIQPIREIARICRGKGVLLHTDAAQTVGKIPTSVDELGVDFLTVAGHKVYAPKGIGALYIRRGTAIEPLIHGAGQEGGRRAGTENVAFDVGLGQACEIAFSPSGMETVRELTGHLHNGLRNLFGPGIRLNGHPTNRLPNTLYVSFLGLSTESVLLALGDTAVSTGSACHSGSTKLSGVLAAMGISSQERAAHIRFSLGRFTVRSEIDMVLANLSALAGKSRDRAA